MTQQDALSRRQVLNLTAGAGVAAAAAAMVGTAALTSLPGPAESVATDATNAVANAADAVPMVVRVRDLAAGTLELFVGDERIELRDPALATVLANAGRGETGPVDKAR